MSDGTTPPQFDQSPGMLGQSPSFWSNLANFGGNLAVASNARDGQGFLTYGQGAAGPLGAAVLANQHYQQQNPFLAAELQRTRLANQGASMQNQLTQMRMPLEQAQTAALTKLYQGGIPGATPDQGAAASPSTPAAGSSLPLQGRIASFEGNDPSAMNKYGYAGKYSMGTAALADAGVYNPAPGEDLSKNEWKGQIAVAPFQPTTISGFLANPAMQDAAYNAHIQNVDKQIKTLGLDDYVGKTVSGIPITQEDLQAGVHFAGAGNMQNWLKSGGKAPWTDGSGVTIPTALGAMRAAGSPIVSNSPAGGSQTAAPAGGADQDAMAKANRYYAMAQQASYLNPALAATYKDQGDKWFDVAQTGPKASAAANAEAAASWQKPIVTRTGVYDPRSNKEVYRTPEYHELQAQGGAKYPAFITPNEGGGLTISGGPPGVKPGEIPPEQISPTQEGFLKGRGEDLAKQFHEIDERAEASKETNYQIDNMRQASLNFPMGAWADSEQALRTNLAAAGKTLGLDTSSLDAPSANYQAFAKASGALVRAAMHETGGRAASEYSMIQKSLPAPSNVQEGFNTVADQLQGVSDYNIARQKFAQSYKGSPQDFNVAFNSTMSPTSFMINRMALTPSGQTRLQGMVANMQATEGGRKLLKGMLDQYKNAKSGGYFDGLGIGDSPQGAP